MSKRQRVNSVLIGGFMLLLSLIMFLIPEEGMLYVVLILGFSLVLYGGKMLYYYFTMARHMVGGRMSLYLSVITLDLGIFILSIYDLTPAYIAVYLLIIHAFSGVIGILRGMEAKKLSSPLWRSSIITGAINIILAVLSIVLLRSTIWIIYLFSAGVMYDAIMRIVSAFRRTSVVYIQ